MSQDTSLQTIENLVNSVVAEDGTVFLVDLRVKNNSNIKVFLDADNGITIEKCTQINRTLYKKIEEAGLFADGNFSLEVSSPGIDEPLKLIRQYKKNIGRKVEVTFNDDTKKEGRLLNITDDEIAIEEIEGKGKKQIIKTTNILFNQIRHTKVLVTF